MGDDAKKEEADRDAILRRLLKTPPQPRKPSGGKDDKASEKGKRDDD